MNRVHAVPKTLPPADAGEPDQTTSANPLQRFVRRIDRYQRHHRAAGIGYGVIKKYSDDNCGGLAVQLSYTLFVTVFPLLLLLLTVLGLVLASDHSAQVTIERSVFSQFPIVGKNLAQNVRVVRHNSAFGLAIGLIGLIYGSTNLAQTGLYAMAQVWNVPMAVRPNYMNRLKRSLAFLVLLGLGTLATTAMSGFATAASPHLLLRLVAEAATVLVNVALFYAAFRVLTLAVAPSSSLWPGAVVSGVLWTVLQTAGTFVVGHDLRHANAVYGVFGVVLGLMAWIYLGAQISLYGAELNVVVHSRLWPRSLGGPVTPADATVYQREVLQAQRRRDQIVTTAESVPSTP